MADADWHGFTKADR